MQPKNILHKPEHQCLKLNNILPKTDLNMITANKQPSKNSTQRMLSYFSDNDSCHQIINEHYQRDEMKLKYHFFSTNLLINQCIQMTFQKILEWINFTQANDLVDLMANKKSDSRMPNLKQGKHRSKSAKDVRNPSINFETDSSLTKFVE